MSAGESSPEVRPVSPEDGFAEGFVHLCRQRHLMFGSDRRVPVDARPVVRVRQDGVRAVVLPCTTKLPDRPADFFELTPDRVEWTRAGVESSRAFWRYEVVPRSVLEEKIGVMPHGARIDLLKWLMQRY